MTIEKIEVATKAFAAQRTAVISDAACMQLELDAVHKRYAPKLRGQVEQLMKLQAELTEAIEANTDLFPDGSKTRVIEGIKVGFQAGKATLAGVDPTVTVVKLELLRDRAKDANDRERLERIAAALMYQPKLNDAGLRKLTPEEMQEAGISLQPGAQSVLIKPADGDAYKAVEATIKTVMAQTEDV
jgi:phage host-nuclease inhibitor protein Gam